MSRNRKIRKRVVTWCQASHRNRKWRFWRCQLAASWHVVLDDTAMANHSDFQDFYEQCSAWRKHMQRTFPTFSDIDAEIQLSMWEHYSNGVTNEQEMFRRVSVDVRRYVRGEARQSAIACRLRELQPDTMFFNGEDDRICQLVEAVTNTQRLAKVAVPDAAQAWVVHASAATFSPISGAERMAGRRWAKRARKALGQCVST